VPAELPCYCSVAAIVVAKYFRSKAQLNTLKIIQVQYTFHFILKKILTNPKKNNFNNIKQIFPIK